MKTVAYDGVAAVTTDEVADALLELAVTVARFNSYELVTIPVLGTTKPEELTLMLGPTIHLSAMTGADLDESVLEQSRAAATRLQARSRALLGPLHDAADGLEAFFAG